MELSCSKCNNNCIFKDRPTKGELFGSACDYCKLTFCKKCAGISTSEAQTLALVERRLLFYCCDCRESFRDQRCEKILERLHAENKRLQEQITFMETAHEDGTTNLEMRIRELQTVIKAKDEAALRVRRSTLDFEDEVFLAEQTNQQKVTEQHDRIACLERELQGTIQQLGLERNEKLEITQRSKKYELELLKYKGNIKSRTRSASKEIGTTNEADLKSLEDDSLRKKYLEEKLKEEENKFKKFKKDKRVSEENFNKELTTLKQQNEQTLRELHLQTAQITEYEREIDEFKCSQENLIGKIKEIEKDLENSDTIVKSLQDLLKVERCTVPIREIRTCSNGTQTASTAKNPNRKSTGIQTKLTSIGPNTLNSIVRSISPKGNCQPIHAPSNPRRLLIMGSSFCVRNIPKLLKFHSRTVIDINCQYSIEPLTLEGMARKGCIFSGCFSMEDHVVIFLDSRSADEQVSLDSVSIQGILDFYKNTNLIIVGASQIMTPYRQKQHIYKYNLLIKKLIHDVKSEAVYISPDRFMPELSVPNHQSFYTMKENLVSFLSREHLNYSKSVLEVEPRAKLSFEERLHKILGRTEDDWHPGISTFPKAFPPPSDALRRLSLPFVNLVSPMTSPVKQNFRERNLEEVNIG